MNENTTCEINTTSSVLARKSCSETNTKAALRYRQLAILNLI